jgi:hypothetical protein
MCFPLSHLGRAIQTIPSKVNGNKNSISSVALVLHVHPENVGSFDFHLLIPAGMTGADILHPILVRAGDR